MKEQQSQNLLLKVDPLSTIRNNNCNKLITQGEKLETSAKFCIDWHHYALTDTVTIRDTSFCFSYFAAFRTQRNTDSFCFVERFRWTACVQRKFELYINKEPSK